MSRPSSRDEAAHELFGPYQILERLGMGGMATVHRARERGIAGLERIVALKRLLPHLAESAEFIHSFVHEAKLASQLSHPNIVQIYELGRVGPRYYISMELIEGHDLRAILRRSRRAGPTPIEITLSILEQLCDALAYAHALSDSRGNPLGLVHRDVSPSNVIVHPSGVVKVIDFGIAKATTSEMRTRTGNIKGKLAYLSPEGISGEEVDRRSDLFSVGILAYELLCARPLFARKNDYDTLMAVQAADVPPISHYNPMCPPRLEALVHRALAPDRADRWQSASQMRDELIDIGHQLGARVGRDPLRSWLHAAFAAAPDDEPEGAEGAVNDSVAPPPALEEDDDILEIAWGGRSRPEGVPVVIEGVPDRSQSDSSPAPGGKRRRRKRHDAYAPIWANETLRFLGERDSTSEPVKSAEALPTSAGGEPGERALPAPARKRRLGTPGIARSFGASFVDEHRGRPLRALLALLLIAAVGAGAYLLVRHRKPAAVRPDASLRFDVQPADSVIEVEGQAPHTGSPHAVAVIHGRYQVRIHREGYKSWVSRVELGRDETQTIRVVLDEIGSDKAKVAIRSTPPGLPISLDGKKTDHRTPATLELEPGRHAVELAITSDPLWKHSFDVIADTNYEFHPIVDKRRVRRHWRRLRERRRGKNRRRDPAGEEAPDAGVKGASVDAGISAAPSAAPKPASAGDAGP